MHLCYNYDTRFGNLDGFHSLQYESRPDGAVFVCIIPGLVGRYHKPKSEEILGQGLFQSLVSSDVLERSAVSSLAEAAQHATRSLVHLPWTLWLNAPLFIRSRPICRRLQLMLLLMRLRTRPPLILCSVITLNRSTGLTLIVNWATTHVTYSNFANPDIDISHDLRYTL
jgi:hypothetical protein